MNRYIKAGGHIALTFALLSGIPACDQNQKAAHTPTTTIGTDVDDTLITTRVKSALMQNENVKSFDISVTTINGAVTLSGFVDNQNQIDISTKVARSVDGVKVVNNQLAIKEAMLR
jgi:hyperosmotically inducible protein